MKVSITLDFDSPDHAIVALNHIDELRKGNFGETTTKATEAVEPPAKVTKPRKPRKPKAEPAAPVAEEFAPPAGTPAVPSLADVQAAVKGIFETKGAVVALGLLKALGAERAADLPEDKRADFIAQAKAL